jgi:ribonuclease HI
MIELYTDGSSFGNPGPSGWSVVLKFGKHVEYLAHGALNSTAPRMELYAVYRGLKAIKNWDHEVTVYTDHLDTVRTFNDWIKKWKARGWKRSGNKDIANLDIIQAIDDLIQDRKVSFQWVKAHNGHEWNEFTDELAKEGAELAKAKLASQT